MNAEQPEDVAAFSYLLLAADQLESLAEEPNELVYRVDELSTSVNSINTQIANFVDLINDNDIAIDRIYIYQKDAKLPKGLNLFASIGMSAKRFVNSFFGQSYSANNTDESHIQVWVNRPRQYVEIMQKMIDEEFTPQTGIEVDLSIMTDAQKLILSNASGDTPDIATGINYSIPYDLAIRGALVDLTKFDNYQEVSYTADLQRKIMMRRMWHLPQEKKPLQNGEYYYLFLSYGNLEAKGGYNVRIYRSERPDGDYVDEKGNTHTTIPISSTIMMLLIISFVTLGVIHFEIEKMILISAIAAAVMFVYRVVILILKYMK